MGLGPITLYLQYIFILIFENYIKNKQNLINMKNKFYFNINQKRKIMNPIKYINY